MQRKSKWPLAKGNSSTVPWTRGTVSVRFACCNIPPLGSSPTTDPGSRRMRVAPWAIMPVPVATSRNFMPTRSPDCSSTQRR